MAELSTPPVEGETSPEPPQESWGWTRAQRRLAGILAGVVILFVIVGVARRPADVDDPLVTTDGRPMTLPERMDPNTASAAQLETIPHVSAKVAGNIVLYRDARKSQAANGEVFQELGDLSRVPGVTKAVLSQAGPYLQFPADTADTQPMP